jgi:hypothetical protein
MNINRHKGTEADQSHNYMIDVTRAELKTLDDAIQYYLTDDELDSDTYDILTRMGNVIAKFIE